MNRRNFLAQGGGLVAAMTTSHAVDAQQPHPTLTVPHTLIRRVEADGVNVFYREAGPQNAPVVLLLHGFPSSSFMFRELIPRLADRYRVIAPDLAGFGFTEVPAKRKYTYTFDALARTIETFTEALELNHYALYVFDYGAPTGFRLAMAHPERVTAIVSQNGNAYEEGLGEAWAPIQRYWREPTADNREAVHRELNADGIRTQYTYGVPNPAMIAPEGYTLDAAMIDRPGNMDTFQVIRRTIATLAQKKGTVKDVQGVMRHSRTATTTDVYMQEIPASVQSTINSINRELRGSMAKSRKKSAQTGSVVVGRRKPIQRLTPNDTKRPGEGVSPLPVSA